MEPVHTLVKGTNPDTYDARAPVSPPELETLFSVNWPFQFTTSVRNIIWFSGSFTMANSSARAIVSTFKAFRAELGNAKL